MRLLLDGVEQGLDHSGRRSRMSTACLPRPAGVNWPGSASTSAAPISRRPCLAGGVEQAGGQLGRALALTPASSSRRARRIAGCSWTSCCAASTRSSLRTLLVGDLSGRAWRKRRHAALSNRSPSPSAGQGRQRSLPVGRRARASGLDERGAGSSRPSAALSALGPAAARPQGHASACRDSPSVRRCQQRGHGRSGRPGRSARRRSAIVPHRRHVGLRAGAARP